MQKLKITNHKQLRMKRHIILIQVIPKLFLTEKLNINTSILTVHPAEI